MKKWLHRTLALAVGISIPLTAVWATDYYDASGIPVARSAISSAEFRTEFSAIQTGISEKLPALTGNGDNFVVVNTGGTALTSITSSAAATLLGAPTLSANEVITGQWTFEGRVDLDNGSAFRWYDSTDTDYVNGAHNGTDMIFTSVGTTAYRFQDASSFIVQDGAGLQIQDTTDTDYVRFAHDGTSLQITDSGTTNIEINSIPLSLQAGPGGRGLYNQSTLNWTSSTLNLPATDWRESDNTVHAGLRVQTNDGVAGNAQMQWFAGNFATEVMRLDLANRLELLAGRDLRVYDSTNADYLEFAHNGTNVELNVSGTTQVNVQGLPDSGYFQVEDGGNFRIFDLGNTDWMGMIETGTQAQLVTNSNNIYFWPGGSTNTMVVADSVVDVRGVPFRVYDAGITDYVDTSHNGSDYTVNGVNTGWFDVTSFTSGVRLRDGADLRVYDSTDVDYVSILHDGTNGIFDQNTGDFYFQNGVQVRGGTIFTINNATNTASVQMYHAGGDLTLNGNSTTDINILGVTAIAAGTVDADFDAVTATSYGGVPEANLPNMATLYKTADESVTNSITLQNDDHFAGWSLDANTFYAIEGYISVDTSATGYNMQWSFSQAPQDGHWTVESIETDSTEERDKQTITTAFADGSVADPSIHITGHFRTNATTGGTLTLQWAQNVNNAAPTTFEAGSWIRITRLGT